MTIPARLGDEAWVLLQEAMDEASSVCGTDVLPCPCSERDCLAGRYKRLKQKIREAEKGKKR